HWDPARGRWAALWEGGMVRWTAVVNRPTAGAELEGVRHCVIGSAPLGERRWVDRVVRALGVEATQRRRGRPKKR
ncbi:MAG: hypothetical protein NTU53_11795, partial [Planctomycetota bacterium]|nr:hypothetical protein [Planctomycetota bacterium]